MTPTPIAPAAPNDLATALASPEPAHAVLFAGAARAAERLTGIAGEYEPKGILHSEMLAACGAFDLLDCDLIIESGRCRGQSTSVLADYFAGRPVRIVSVELTRDDTIAPFAERRLAGRTNVELLYGDSLELLPQICRDACRDNPRARIGLLIDGPKSYTAIKLIERLVASFPNIRVACLHDADRTSEARKTLASSPFHSAFTDDVDFVGAYRHLDDACVPVAGRAIRPHAWRPGMTNAQATESYGPTLAILLPRSFCSPPIARTPKEAA